MFLSLDRDCPWPAQMRTLEALGSLRRAGSPTAPGKVEMADLAMRFLADPAARPEVALRRLALGMMRVTSANGCFNFALIAYHIGELSAAIGERIASSDLSKGTAEAEYLTSLLVYQIYPALNGQPGGA